MYRIICYPGCIIHTVIPIIRQTTLSKTISIFDVLCPILATAIEIIIIRRIFPSISITFFPCFAILVNFLIISRRILTNWCSNRITLIIETTCHPIHEINIVSALICRKLHISSYLFLKSCKNKYRNYKKFHLTSISFINIFWLNLYYVAYLIY